MSGEVRTRTPDVVGREDELAAIDAVLDEVLHGGASTLLVEGEAGVGKTSLCGVAIARAQERGFETLAARPVEAEAGLSLTAIGDLLDPVLDRVLSELPEPRARMLRVALLLEGDGGAAPDARALGVCVLGALRILASDAPLFVLVDDVQWLDASSAAALQFAARRLEHEAVAFVFARRSGHPDHVVSGLQDVERLLLGGLSPGALHRLVRERLGLVLARPALRRLHDLSGGNPYYALELSRALESGSIRLEPGEPLPPSLETLVGRRLATLSEQTREALATAAALSKPTTSVASEPTLAPAIAANVIALDGDEIRFTHPLLAAASYAAVDDARRRSIHQGLAGVVDEVEERARHLALAATGPDASVAAALEAASATARSRGAVATAGELAERAVALTPPSEDAARHRRSLFAARCRYENGDATGSRRLLEELADAAEPGPRHAETLTHLARIQMVEGTRRTAVELLRIALDEAGDDARLRAMITERLVNTLVVLREGLREGTRLARRGVMEAERGGDPDALARMLGSRGFIGGVVGDPDAPTHVERAVLLESQGGHWYGTDRPTFNHACVLMYRDELEHGRSLFLDLYRVAAECGDEGSLAWTADNLANIEFLAGNWDDALRWADEGDETASHTGQPGQQAYAKATKALVHAHRGEVEATRDVARAALELSGDEVAIGWMNARWALGVLELSLGNPAAAHEHLGPACDHVEREGIGEPGTTRFVFDDVEALIGLGALDDAERRLRLIEGHARRLDRRFALAASARCRGVLATARGEMDAALSAFAEARVDAETFDAGRTLLALGAALRRAARRREARETLEQAQRIFDRIGAAAWSELARVEASRVGGRTAAGDELTPTERKVVELVAQGLPNREVAAALFVTPKTVEFHLRNVFRKLGVRSRAELARMN